ncbi:MAG: DNA starvation/stationary phase protection protein [Candidatus Babeliales bacterium]
MIDIGIPENNRKEITIKLNVLLANEYILYTKTLNYHWNIVSRDFGALHKFFENQYEELFDIIDAVAERVRSLGFKAYGTLKEFIENTTLAEYPGKYPDDRTMIEHLLKDHETIIKQLRQDADLTMDLNDIGTNNFLTDILEKHEKMAWMLRAHLD